MVELIIFAAGKTIAFHTHYDPVDGPIKNFLFVYFSIIQGKYLGEEYAQGVHDMDDFW